MINAKKWAKSGQNLQRSSCTFMFLRSGLEEQAREDQDQRLFWAVGDRGKVEGGGQEVEEEEEKVRCGSAVVKSLEWQ